jgi:hypothetical protein
MKQGRRTGKIIVFHEPKPLTRAINHNQSEYELLFCLGAAMGSVEQKQIQSTSIPVYV